MKAGAAASDGSIDNAGVEPTQALPHSRDLRSGSLVRELDALSDGRRITYYSGSPTPPAPPASGLHE